VDPADAEPDSRRSQAVRERHEPGVTATCDHDAVHLDPVDESLKDRLAGRGLDERDVEVRLEISG